MFFNVIFINNLKAIMLNGVKIFYTVCAKVNQDLFDVPFIKANTFIMEKVFTFKTFNPTQLTRRILVSLSIINSVGRNNVNRWLVKPIKHSALSVGHATSPCAQNNAEYYI